MSIFPTAGHLASWAGLCPGNDESAGKRRSGRTRKGSRWLGIALTEAAQANTRSRDTYLSAQYRRLKSRRGHRKAIGAVRHSIIVASWHMLKTGELYREDGGDYFTRLDPDKQELLTFPGRVLFAAWECWAEAAEGVSDALCRHDEMKERHVYEDQHRDLIESAGGARSEPGGRAQRPAGGEPARASGSDPRPPRRRGDRRAARGRPDRGGDRRAGRCARAVDEAAGGAGDVGGADRASRLRAAPGAARRGRQHPQRLDRRRRLRPSTGRCGSRRRGIARAASSRRSSGRASGASRASTTRSSRSTRAGLSTRDIEAHLAEIYGVKVGRDLISRVTDAVMDDVREWQQRPLGRRLPGGLPRRAGAEDPRGRDGAAQGLLPRARRHGRGRAGRARDVVPGDRGREVLDAGPQRAQAARRRRHPALLRRRAEGLPGSDRGDLPATRSCRPASST